MINLMLLLFLVIIAIAAIQAKDILNSIMYLGVYSLFMALVWTELNAVDVAFTEAAVGAGVSGVFMIGALTRMNRFESSRERTGSSKYMPVFIVAVTAVMLFYATVDMPAYNNPEAPINKHVAPYYIENSEHETGSVNIVTSVLASYRGYDTLGETSVVFTAAISVILLLRRRDENER
ncbi:DUF4040 domain-containing protein [Geovibrio thiophilus]|uniref:DUF4040 domain-containing protein n=1 Tax=Geovibrio thiophilus TaxID=139438 RepID=A0A410JXP4_9BACT|nr:DUF4040 domain-containing protein [Geovibrio thiophilus]QAR32937.1 DUF4040 domain-containing protein [Geovibrio thiophilus]